MNENALFALLFGIITPAVTATTGMETVAGKQSYQPTQQGVPDGPVYLLQRLFDKRYGYLRRDDQWDAGTSTMIHTETQVMESTFQVDALWTQDPNVPLQLTAGDLVRRISSIMQSDATRAALKAAGVAVLRVQEIRNPKFQNDRDQFQASPSFDFTVQWTEITITTSPAVETYELGIHRV
jgi:hypothetical protein